jgi:hypothetical protein
MLLKVTFYFKQNTSIIFKSLRCLNTESYYATKDSVGGEWKRFVIKPTPVQ